MMMMRRLGQDNGHYEFRDSSRGLTIRGEHPEWVLQAAADIIANCARLEAESLVDELAAMHRLGAANLSELTGARVQQRRRFDLAPRCSVSLGPIDYVWSAAQGSKFGDGLPPQSPLTLGPDMRITADPPHGGASMAADAA